MKRAFGAAWSWTVMVLVGLSSISCGGIRIKANTELSIGSTYAEQSLETQGNQLIADEVLIARLCNDTKAAVEELVANNVPASVARIRISMASAALSVSRIPRLEQCEAKESAKKAGGE